MNILMILLPYGAAMVASLSVLAFIFGVRSLLRRNVTVDARLSTYLEPGSAAQGMDDEFGPVVPAFTERLNAAITQQSFAERVEQELLQADLPLTVPEYLLVRIAVALLLTIVTLLVWRSILVIPPALLIGYIIPVFWLQRRRNLRNRAFNDQLADALALIATSMRGGFSLPQSVAQVAKDAPEPTKRELTRVGREIQLGLSLTQALDNLVVRMESEDLDLVVTAIKIHTRIGGNLTTILDTISNTIRERSRLRRDVRVITSMQRMSSYVIGFLPIGLALIIFTINPKYMSRLFLPGWTLCIPIGAAFFWLVGFLVIRKIVDIKV